MPLIDKLEGLFNVETETTVESAMMEFVTGGSNIKQKTILPLDEKLMCIAFAYQLGKDIDEEFSDVESVLNKIKGIEPLIKGQKNPDLISFSNELPEMITEAMLLAPSLEGKSREELGNAIAAVKSESVTVRNKDSVDKILSGIKSR